MSSVLDTTLESDVTAYLKVYVGRIQKENRIIQLKGTRVSVGRAASNDIILKPLQISGHHCKFQYSARTNKWSIKDTSRNRVAVNGILVSKTDYEDLSDGDLVDFFAGRVTLTYRFHYVSSEEDFDMSDASNSDPGQNDADLSAQLKYYREEYLTAVNEIIRLRQEVSQLKV